MFPFCVFFSFVILPLLKFTFVKIAVWRGLLDVLSKLNTYFLFCLSSCWWWLVVCNHLLLFFVLGVLFWVWVVLRLLLGWWKMMKLMKLPGSLSPVCLMCPWGGIVGRMWVVCWVVFVCVFCLSGGLEGSVWGLIGCWVFGVWLGCQDLGLALLLMLLFSGTLLVVCGYFLVWLWIVRAQSK